MSKVGELMKKTPSYHGIIPPMVTPLAGRDRLDEAGLGNLIEHILGGGVHGLFLLGTTGEGPALGYDLRKDLIQAACLQVARRVPILVGITDTSVVQALEMARCAAENGADAVVLAPPYYFPNSQPELLEFLECLAPELPLPLFLYNMPTHTKTVFEIDTVRRLMEVENIAGFKDSSGNMVYYHQLIQLLPRRPDWTLLMGPEELLGESVLLGGHGGVCGGANLCPRLYVELYEAACSGDVARVAEMHAKVMRISSSLYRVGNQGSAFLKGLKCALSQLAICDDWMTEPFQRFQKPEREKVGRLLEDLGMASRSAAMPAGE